VLRRQALGDESDAGDPGNDEHEAWHGCHEAA